MVDLAIGVIIGIAFGKVISSLVSDIIMPPIGLLLGGIDFTQFSLKMHLPGEHCSSGRLEIWDIPQQPPRFRHCCICHLHDHQDDEVPAEEKEKEEAPKTQDCPECRMAIPVDARKCGHCCSVLKQTEHERVLVNDLLMEINLRTSYPDRHLSTQDFYVFYEERVLSSELLEHLQRSAHPPGMVK